MKKSMLFSINAILLLGITQNFDGQEKSQSHRQLPGGGDTGIERQSKMAQAPFFSRQEPNRLTADQTLPHRHRITRPKGHQDDRTHAMMKGNALAQHELSAGVDTAWVRHYDAVNISSNEWAHAIAIDDSGNIYVTGESSRNADDTSDYLTIKYDSYGTQLWVARYNGSANADDWATALAVDTAGNVYVTGTSEGSGTGGDFATVKYNFAGVQQWVARYNGPENGSDGANALVVDASGNVYVTGESGDEFATVKYNAVGIEQWVAHYNGPACSYAIALDPYGNVYVTGRSGTWLYDYVTVKYDSEGFEQWVARYNGPALSDDRAFALDVDASGNVYVTGTSAGSGTELDFATVKYNSAGVELWVVRYNGPGNAWDEVSALAVDVSNNVYVTGNSGDGFATVKYNSDGVEQWVSQYNGVAIAWDAANVLAVDASGNVYVTGWSEVSGTESDFATVKYNSAGVEQWVSRYNGSGNSMDWASALALDASGNVYVTGTSEGSGTGPDFATIKYNSAGTEQWAVRYNGPASSSNWASALALDASNNVCVTGTSVGSGTGWDYATVKYASSGVEQWIARYNGPGEHWYDEASALAVDASGNAYVTGESEVGFATVKYSSAGIEQWVARLSEGGFASALVVDASGNVYVMGRDHHAFPAAFLYTVKYDSHGDQQWVARFGLLKGQDDPDKAKTLAVDATGNVYVAGTSHGNDFVTVKYNSAGVEQWVARYNGQGNADDSVAALIVDASGNVYVTGASSGSGMGNDFATVKYNSAGAEQWVTRFNGLANADDRAAALAMDASGNVYVTGTSVGSDTGYDFATVKYDSAGVQQWIARYDGPGNSGDRASALAVDASGNIYVSGTSMGSGTGGDFATVKYNSAGVEQWVARYNGQGNADDGVAALAVDASGNIYVTGTSRGDYWIVYTTVKYIQTPVSVEKEEPGEPRAYELTQNYPNPFNPTTTIEFALPKASLVILKIYDLLGNEVATLVSEKLPAGKHQRVWEAKGLASGVYLYRLEAGGFEETKKLILMR